LLSEFEIFGTKNWAISYESSHQKQMSYYATGNSKIKYRHDSLSTAARWWTASVAENSYKSGTYAPGFCIVDSNGTSPESKSSCYPLGLAPAFKV
jgi:hypothetical protein